LDAGWLVQSAVKITSLEELAQDRPILAEAIIRYAESVHEGNRESDIPPTRGVRLIVGMIHKVTFSGKDKNKALRKIGSGWGAGGEAAIRR
jgi:hypothetical protein